MPVLLMIVLLIGTPAMGHGAVLDRILAVVNSQIISLSDVQGYVTVFTVEPADQGKDFSGAVLNDGLEAIIRHKLLLEQARRFGVENPPQALIRQEVAAIRKPLGNRQHVDTILKHHGMTPDDLERMAQENLMVRDFIEQRIGFFVIVLPREVEQYYAEHAGAHQGQTLQEAREEIEEHLFLKRKLEKLEQYLNRLRAEAQIQINFRPGQAP